MTLPKEEQLKQIKVKDNHEHIMGLPDDYEVKMTVKVYKSLSAQTLHQRDRELWEKLEANKVTAEYYQCGEGCCNSITFSNPNIIDEEEMETYNQAISDIQQLLNKEQSCQ